MKLRAYTMAIVFESETGEEMEIRQGTTWLKITTNIREDAYIGSVMDLKEHSLTLLYEGETKYIDFKDIKEVSYFNPLYDF